MNVEFYTSVDERLDVPVVLPPTLDLVDIRGIRVLIADDVADTGKTLELVRKEISEHVAEARTAVLYHKPWSIITPEYVWRTPSGGSTSRGRARTRSCRSRQPRRLDPRAARLPAMARPIVVDTDGGVDDAVALWWALTDPALDVVAITVVWGNVPLTSRPRACCGSRTRRPRRRSGCRRCRRVRSQPRPYLRPATFIHGDDGLGNSAAGGAPGARSTNRRPQLLDPARPRATGRTRTRDARAAHQRGACRARTILRSPARSTSSW